MPASLLRLLAGCPERFSCPLFIEYGIAGNRVFDRIPRASHACRITPSRLCLEHPWTHALGDYRLANPQQENPAPIDPARMAPALSAIRFSSLEATLRVLAGLLRETQGGTIVQRCKQNDFVSRICAKNSELIPRKTKEITTYSRNIMASVLLYL